MVPVKKFYDVDLCERGMGELTKTIKNCINCTKLHKIKFVVAFKGFN